MELYRIESFLHLSELKPIYIKVLLRNTEFIAILTLKFHLEIMIPENDWKTFKGKTATI